MDLSRVKDQGSASSDHWLRASTSAACLYENNQGCLWAISSRTMSLYTMYYWYVVVIIAAATHVVGDWIDIRIMPDNHGTRACFFAYILHNR